MAAAKNINKDAPKPPMPTHSQELEKLSFERDGLLSEKNALEKKQDFWHTMSIIAACIAGIIGFIAIGAQFRESRLAYLIRPKIAGVSARENQISALEKENSDTAIGIIGKEAAKATERAKDAELKIADANRQAEADRLARVKIEERLAWRRVNAKQYNEFLKVLLPFAGSKVVVFVFSNEDLEAKTFASDLMHLLHDGAKWEAVLNDTNTAIPLPTGLVCELDTSSDAGKALGEVMSKYSEAQIVHTKLPGIVGVIRVGSKPPP